MTRAAVSLSWVDESARRLIGCGVDAERIERFEKLVGEDRPWPLVFHAREVERARTLPNPAEGLCAAFCCKEALYKAVAKPVNFNKSAFLFDPAALSVTVDLAREVREAFGIASVSIRILRPAEGELMAVLYLFGEAEDE
jgi:phosphopantetheinyl transferase (holo-ACP synthase)